MAPEVISDRIYGKPVDWWACGVTFYECLTREHLFVGKDKGEIVQKILTGPICLKALDAQDERLGGLVRGLLIREQSQRLGSTSAQDIKEHAFFAHIDWSRFSEMDPVIKPAQRVKKKHSDQLQRQLFYGEPDCQVRQSTVSLSSASGGTPSARAQGKKKKKSKSSRSTRSVKPNFLNPAEVRRGWLEGRSQSKSHSQSLSRSYSNSKSNTLNSFSIATLFEGSESSKSDSESDSTSRSKSKSKSVEVKEQN